MTTSDRRFETGSPPRLEGRFKDGRDRIDGPRPETGDLRVAPRPGPPVRRKGVGREGSR